MGEGREKAPNRIFFFQTTNTMLIKKVPQMGVILEIKKNVYGKGV